MPIATFNNTIGKPFTELTSVDSTNNYAMEQVQAGDAQHGAAWFAHEQTAGKGQRGKAWQTAKGENIIVSVVLNTKWVALSRQFYFSAAMALAAHDFFSKYALSETKIKWPNDIYWRDRKAGGILIENIIKGSNWQWAIVGIGININQTNFDPLLLNTVSLKQVTSKNFDPVALTKELCEYMQQRYQQLEVRKDVDILNLYNEVLYKRNETVQLNRKGEIIYCFLKGVNALGELEVQHEFYNHFKFGEVEWVINDLPDLERKELTTKPLPS